MTQPDISINTDSVRRHAAQVDETGAKLDEAVRAGAYMRASNESYGTLYGAVFTGPQER